MAQLTAKTQAVLKLQLGEEGEGVLHVWLFCENFGRYAVRDLVLGISTSIRSKTGTLVAMVSLFELSLFERRTCRFGTMKSARGHPYHQPPFE
mmetsp:Transcript_4864/g.13818  ORF Transcript_4864/g.13818 Transcript_4864/m.13818 type:complete len:93 (-) Transcript_4864:3286-3564(-)